MFKVRIGKKKHSFLERHFGQFTRVEKISLKIEETLVFVKKQDLKTRK